MNVGGDLFKILLGEGASTSTSTTLSKDTIAPPPPPVQQEEKKDPIKQSHGRVPLIKFLGPRKFSHTKPAATQAASESKPVAQAIKKEGNRIIYEQVQDMPRRFHPIAFSKQEMDLINVI